MVKGNIQKFTETSVIFEDGYELKDVDEVVMATGYWFDFPYLDSGRLVPVVENRCTLYKKMFPLQSADKNTIAMIGLLQVDSLKEGLRRICWRVYERFWFFVKKSKTNFA